jgi:uncharacterized protein (UPF0332 family)
LGWGATELDCFVVTSAKTASDPAKGHERRTKPFVACAFLVAAALKVLPTARFCSTISTDNNWQEDEAQMNIPDVRLYLDRAREDLLAAESNIQQGFYGVAISRAYYAMFYAANALLASKGLSRSKHSGVHSAFGEQFVKNGLLEPEYGRMLLNAFDSRLDADYEAGFTARREVAEAVLDNARKFVARMERYLQEADLT